MKKGILIILGFVIAIGGCKKDDDETSTIPEIEFVSISHSQVVAFENFVEITFSYKDLDGDIGYQDPDVYALRVKDDRLKSFDWYHIPPLTPENEPLQVEGQFSVELSPLFLLGNGSQESTKFTLQVQDRAGNWSNQIITPVVLINDSL
jgi:hypothetical protein